MARIGEKYVICERYDFCIALKKATIVIFKIPFNI
jgi:hypothetical protein